MRLFHGLAGVTLAAAGIFLSASAARAGDFLIDPTGGTDITSDFTDTDDGVASRFTGLSSFSLFDLTRTGGVSGVPINVTTNGFLHLRAVGEGANVSPANAALPTGGGIHRIAGLWDDFYIENRTGDSIIESKGTNFYAITYYLHKTPVNSGGAAQFQIALFGGDYVSADGHTFQANDIAFSYKKLVGSPVGGTATVGLDAGDNAHFTAPSDFPNGLVNDYSKLVNYSSDGSGSGGAKTGFYKFTRTGSGSYTASLIPTGPAAAAPEPGTLTLVAVGLIGMNGVARRRRPR